jgi:hypothetical protein
MGPASLYLIASARANHLLTITTHVELGQGEHDDPRGLDLQVLYDAITVKLSALSKAELGAQAVALPAGVRYGINPLRNRDPAKLAAGSQWPKVLASRKWGFPHQSGP